MYVKKKTVIGIIVAAAVILAMLVFGLPLFSHLVYGRSQAATLFAWQLHKEAYTTAEAFEEYLAVKSAENSGPYLLPREVEFTVPVKPDVRGGQAEYVLNEDGRASSSTLPAARTSTSRARCTGGF